MTTVHVRAGSLIAGMIAGTLSIWTLSPLTWLWIASHMDEGSSPSMGAIGVVIVGIALTTIAIAKGLAMLNARYLDLHGTRRTIKVHLPWLRSLRGDRPHERGGRAVELTVLDVILISSVFVAIGLYEAWFLFLSDSPFDQRTGRG